MNELEQRGLLKVFEQRESQLCTDGQRAIPQTAIDRMLDSFKIEDDARVLVMFCPILATKIRFAGKDVSLYVEQPSVALQEVCRRLRIEILTTEDRGMKFDLVLGNPPFSKVGDGSVTGKGKKSLLYPKFLKLAIESAPCGAMIMPTTVMPNRDNQEHIDTIKENAYYIENLSEQEVKQMNVGIEMWTVYWGRKGDVSEHFGSMEAANDLDIQTGSARLGNHNQSPVKTKTHAKKVIRSILKDGIDEVWTDYNKTPLNAGWYLLLTRRVTTNGFNSAVVKLDGTLQCGSNIRYISVPTKKEGKRLEEILNSEYYVESVLPLTTHAGNITVAAMRSVKI